MGKYFKNLLRVFICFSLFLLFSCEVVSDSDPMDCSPPGSSVNGISQARALEWLPFLSPGDLLDPGTEPGSSALQADSLPPEPPGNQRMKEAAQLVR